MAEQNSRDQLLNECHKKLSNIQNFDPQSLSRSDDLGSYSFNEILDEAQQIVSLFRLVDGSRVDLLPAQQLTQLRDTANQAASIFGKVLSFDPKEYENPNSVHVDIVNEVKHNWTHTYNKLSGLIGFLSSSKSDSYEKYIESRLASYFDKFSSEIGETLANLEDSELASRKMVEQIASQKAKSEAALSSIQNIAAKSGVVEQAVFFKQEYQQNESDSFKWLVSTVILSIALAVLVVLSLVFKDAKLFLTDDTYGLIQVIVSKTIVYATVSSLIVLSIKNYNSTKHNSTVNRHRHNALCTYEAIVNAAGDDANRDIVLTYAAICIFSDQPSGYNKNDTSESISAIAMPAVSPAIKSVSGT